MGGTISPLLVPLGKRTLTASANSTEQAKSSNAATGSESVVHTACRRGAAEVLRFFMDEAGVSVRVKCDCGRTPLHDACWTHRPNFELIKMLITECPDLLIITDNRNFTPLQYVRQEQYPEWRAFLD